MDKKLKRDILLFLLALIMMGLILIIDFNDSTLRWMWIFTYAFGGFSKAEEGVKLTIENKSLNVEFLMILAAIGAAVIGYYSEGAILILIFSLSGILEEYSMNKAQNTLTSLLTLAPDVALLVNNDEEIEVEAKTLKVNDHIKVLVGQQIPADGVVVQGNTHVDQASITGEYMLVYKSLDDQVFAGTLNLEGAITVQVTKNPSEFLINRMSNFVLDAKQNKTKRQSSIEKFEAKYVYIVLLLAFLTITIPPLLNIWTFDTSIYRAIVFLVVASPCALVASTAPAMLSAMSWGGKHGILIKGSNALDLLSKTDLIVFDKTGTVTVGKPMVKEFVVDNQEQKQEIVDMIVALERQSNHPLAKVVVDYLGERFTINDHQVDIKEFAGRGVIANVNEDKWEIGNFKFSESPFADQLQKNKEGYSVIRIIKNNDLVAYLLLHDTIREDSPETIKKLKAMNVKTMMLTGDHDASLKPVLEKLPFDDYRADLLPEDKSDIIQELKERYETITMIGDGINDAPSLAVADVGIAMGEGTDVALETADIVFMNNKLSNAVDVVKLAKKAHQIVSQNIIFSMSVLVVLVILNVFQSITLPFGVLLHEGSTILVILNSLRLLVFNPKH